MLENDAPTIEFMILVEHAEVIHGKLYIMGGGGRTSRCRISRTRSPCRDEATAGALVQEAIRRATACRDRVRW